MLESQLIPINANKGLFFREAIETDLDLILKINRAEMDEILKIAWQGSFKWNKWIIDVKRAMESSRHRVFVIEVNSEPIGSLWVSDDDNWTLWVTSIVIIKEWQRKGMGKDIMEYLIKVAKEDKKRFIELGVQKNNEQAMKFYNSIGFVRFDFLRYANTELKRLNL